ncbi:MAG: hypothetical protein ACK4NP_12015 [Parvularculaceae bacterium]
MSRLRTFLAGLALAVALPAAADAAVVTVRDNPGNGSSVFATGLGRSVTIRHNGVNRTVGAGVFSLQYGTGGDWTDILTFCLELSARLTLPKDHERIAGEAYFPNAVDRQALGILYGNFMTADYGLKNADTGAAMQILIWEIIEDGAANFDLDGGAFKILTSSVRSEALTLWSLLTSGDFKPVRFDVLAARGTQDLIVSEVPLPGALTLFGTALAAGAMRRRPRKS